MKRLYTTPGPAALPAGLGSPPVSAPAIVPIMTTADIVAARRYGRELGELRGATDVQATLIATIISELARNILLFAGTGEMLLTEASDSGRAGVDVTATDRGPGIRDLQRALLGGYSTCGRMGLGLSGVRRMADEFDVTTGPETGTTVFARKWFS